MSSLRTYFDANKKVIISATALFVVGIILGVIFAYRSVDGNFERVIRSEAELGAAKVFFISLLILVGGYGIILVSGINNKTVFLIIIPFVLIGYMLGKYATALIARYESFGVINLVFVYLPFFFLTFILMMIAAANVISAACCDRCERSSFKPSFLQTLKILGINAACALLFFLIIGSFTGVIIVKVY